MKRLKLLAVSLIVAAVGLLVYCGSFYIKSYMENHAAKESYEALAYLALASEGESGYASGQGEQKDIQKDTDQKNADQKTIDQNNTTSLADTSAENIHHTDTIRESFGISWENLRNINPDVVAWITIPGADISYPVV